MEKEQARRADSTLIKEQQAAHVAAGCWLLALQLDQTTCCIMHILRVLLQAHHIPLQLLRLHPTGLAEGASMLFKRCLKLCYPCDQCFKKVISRTVVSIGLAFDAYGTAAPCAIWGGDPACKGTLS